MIAPDRGDRHWERSPMALLEELKRRKVFKVGGAYLVVAWLAVQAVSIGFPAFEAPPWALRVFILVAMLGFPISLVFAWVFDVTPEGLKTEPISRGSAGFAVLAVALVLLALGWYFKGQPTYRSGDLPAVAGPSVAVLPFANMSGKADEEYFSDGMTEELLNVLAKVPKLSVAARTSVFEFKGKGGDVREIGRKLGVTHIVEGSIRRDGGQVRVTAQLIRVADGFHVWSERYDRELKGVFALQDELARQIGTQLQSRLGVGELPAARAPIAPEAYDEYLRGRDLYRRREDMPGAIRHLSRAVELAPDFGAGWASLALAHEVFYWTTSEAEREAMGDSYALMLPAAERAAALDPGSALTLHARANVARANARYAEALALYGQAVSSDPSYPDVREDFAELLVNVGRHADGEGAIRALLKLDSHNALFWWRLAQLGYVTGQRATYDEAMQRMREINPRYRYGYVARLIWPMARGDVVEARRVLAEVLAESPGNLAADAVMFHWAVDDPGADAVAARREVLHMNLRGSHYAVLKGDLDLLIESFDRPVARTTRHGLYVVLSMPKARPWLADPRAKDALRRHGFVAYWREAGWPAGCRAVGSDDFECDTGTEPR